MTTPSHHSHIQVQMIVRMAIANLRFKRFRSIITILGVVIGIGSIYLLLTFGMGLQQLVQSQIIGNRSINTIDITSADSKIISLTPQTVQVIQSIAHVTHVSGVYTLASKVTIDGSSADPVAYGVDATYLSLSDLNVTAGTVINPEKSDELLVNSSLLQAIGVKDPASAIGKQATVLLTLSDGSTFEKHTRIVGIVNSGSGSEVFLSEKTFQEASVPTFAEAKALVDDKAFVPDARHAIESLGYQTSSPVDTIDQINQVFHLFNLILIGLGSVGMIIAVLGMLNTLTVSLLERTKEIALMIALGARPKDMQRLFTAEAVILSLTGGIIGMLLATGVGRVTDLILNGFAKGRGVAEGFSLFAVSPLLIVGTLIFMVVIGVGVSFIPARHASRINAVEALRQE